MIEDIEDILNEVTQLVWDGAMNGDFETTSVSLFSVEMAELLLEKAGAYPEGGDMFWKQFTTVNQYNIPNNMALLSILGYTVYHGEEDVAGKNYGTFRCIFT